MKKENLVSFIGFIITFMVMLSVTNHILVGRRQETAIKAAYYETGEEYDVLFFGPSTTVNAISPIELYHTYGIRSFNMSAPGLCVSLSYWSLRNALDYSKPKVVVLDVGAFGWNGRSRNTYEEHMVIDSVPLSETKIAEINDLYEYPIRNEYLIPFYYHHMNWKSVDEPWFWNKPSEQYVRGYTLKPSVQIYNCSDKEIPYSEEIAEEQGSVDEEYLRRFIELAQENGIEVVLVLYPSCSGTGSTSRLAQKIGEEYGVPFYNMANENELLGIDLRYDLQDPYHLNAHGAHIVTLSIGEYLINQFSDDIKPGAPDDIWEENYEKYAEEYAEYICEQKDLETILLMLASFDYDIDIEVYDKSCIDSYSCGMLFEELGWDKEIGSSKRDGFKIHFASLEEYDDLDGNTPVMHFWVKCTGCGELLIDMDYSYIEGLYER